MSGIGQCSVIFMTAQLDHFLQAALISFTVCFALLATSAWLSTHIRRADLSARQSVHLRPTLRLGGVGILLAMWIEILTSGNTLLLTLLVCSLPVFLTGFLEDIGYSQSPRRRLALAALSSGIVIAFSGTYIHSSGFSGLDFMFAVPLFAIAFTMLATAGLIHAFNLVDGMNGLSGIVALAGALGIAAISRRAEVSLLDLPTAPLMGAMLGFLVLNYPAGRIFLGDAGAYTVGFLLAWMAVFLLAEAPSVSPWALVLVFFWPIADTLLAIWRRILLRAPVGAPDRLHAHHVAMRVIEILVLKRKDRKLSNPLATLFVTPLILMPTATGVVLWSDTYWSVVAVVGFAFLFVTTYRLAIVSARTLRAFPRPSSARTAFAGVGSKRTPLQIQPETGK